MKPRTISGPSVPEIRAQLLLERMSYAVSQVPQSEHDDLRALTDEQWLEALEGAVCATIEEVRTARQRCGISFLPPIPQTPILGSVLSATLVEDRSCLKLGPEGCEPSRFGRGQVDLLIAELQSLRDLMSPSGDDDPQKEDPSCAASPDP